MVLGISRDGLREVQGLWIAENEGARFWLPVMDELRKAGQIAETLVRLDLVILDEQGFSAAGARPFHLLGKLYECTSVVIPRNPRFRE